MKETKTISQRLNLNRAHKAKVRRLTVIAFVAVIGSMFVSSCSNLWAKNKSCEHMYGEWSQKTAATCTAAEVEKRTCSSCGEEETRTAIPALGHDWNWATYISGSGVNGGIRTCQHGNGCTAIVEIGDTGPCGGIIFFVADGVMPGFTFFQNAADTVGEPRYYLEVDLTTTITNRQWASADHRIPDLSQNDTDNTDWAIGRGMKNTEIIIAHGVAAFPFTHTQYVTRAAELTRTGSHGNGTKDDWFLPSKNELNELASRRTHVKINLDGYSAFWSSSQYSQYNAWNQNFGNGNQSNSIKGGLGNVGAIRAF